MISCDKGIINVTGNGAQILAEWATLTESIIEGFKQSVKTTNEVKELEEKLEEKMCENLEACFERVFSKKTDEEILNEAIESMKELLKKGYISKMVNSRNRINEKIIFLHVSNTEEICDLMHSFLD